MGSWPETSCVNLNLHSKSDQAPLQRFSLTTEPSATRSPTRFANGKERGSLDRSFNEKGHKGQRLGLIKHFI